MSAAAISRRILECGIVPILRGSYQLPTVQEIAEVLRQERIPVLEVTSNSTDAFELISALRRRFDDTMLIGAGTIRSAALVRRAAEAGAQFTIAPNFDRDACAAARELDLLHLPGVVTPSEIQAAVNEGCRLVKLFPMDSFGPQYLKALRAPLDDVQFIPTGGISLDNIGAYAAAGAAAVGLGSALITGPSQPMNDLTARASALRKAWLDNRS